MAVKTLRATPWPTGDCVSAQNTLRDTWPFGCVRGAAALPMQEALLHVSVNAYPYAGSEASDPYSGACPPSTLSVSRDRGMHLRLGAFRTFRGGSRLKSSPKLGSVPSCEDYWSDASLSLPGFPSPSEQIEEIESSKKSETPKVSGGFRPQVSDEKFAGQNPSLSRDDILPEGDDDTESSFSSHIDEEQRKEEHRRVINIRYDIFPPPIVSPTKCNAYTHLPAAMPRVHLRSIKKDGRFILQELPVSTPQRYIRAERGHGRLRLQLIEIEQLEVQASPVEEQEVEQHEDEGAEEEEEAEEVDKEEEGEDKNDDGEVEQEDDPYASASTSELQFDGSDETGNGDAAKANSFQQLKVLSTNPVANWVTTRGFLHESLTRIRPLVY